MRPICVFLCDNQTSYDEKFKETSDVPYHRFFILSSTTILRNKFEEKSTDNFAVFKYDVANINQIAKLVTCFTNPLYTHILIFYGNEIDFDLQKLNFNNGDFFVNENCVGYTRAYYVLNNFDVNLPQNQTYDDPLEYAKNIREALSGSPVADKYFMSAIEELLPQATYNFVDEVPNNLRLLILRKNRPSSTVYNIYNEFKENTNNAIVFSKQDINSYKYAVRRSDGLNFYIL
jgi:hypothetical protein